jgi:hypothetical protein
VRLVIFGQQAFEGRLAAENPFEGFTDVASRINPELLAGRDDRERVSGAPGTFVVAAEKPRFAIQYPRSKVTLDFVMPLPGLCRVGSVGTERRSRVSLRGTAGVFTDAA